MVENCKTEIRKGTAYQSWVWETGLQGGDSKWQLEVWNCKTKVENFAEFEIGVIEELQRHWIKTYHSDSLILSENLIFKQKVFLRDIIKISEGLNLNLNLRFMDSAVLVESRWLYGKLKQSDLISLTDSLKYIIIKYNFNEGFFKLEENLNLYLITPLFDSVKLSDTLFIKVPTGYGTGGYGASRYGD